MCECILYKIRPYTFDLLESIQPYFEMIITSNLPHIHLKHIANHLQIVLNKISRKKNSEENKKEDSDPSESEEDADINNLL